MAGGVGILESVYHRDIDVQPGLRIIHLGKPLKQNIYFSCFKKHINLPGILLKCRSWLVPAFPTKSQAIPMRVVLRRLQRAARIQGVS